ncbi:MAG: hypothetical protein DRH50_13465, partial [Deltaproteobacteria bacterium]
LIIITSYTTVDDQNLSDFKPAIVFVDENNRIKNTTLAI